MRRVCTLVVWLISLDGSAQNVRFAAVGDFGMAGAAELAVSNLIHAQAPDFILTAGDNNYDVGSATTIDANIGQYYHDFISPYLGSYGAGAATNKFWPVLGNHDWGNAFPNPPGANPYLAYFTLPGNERYYEFTQGPVHFFMLDSDPNEPDGNTPSSLQAIWLQTRLAAAAEPWKIVVFHHAAYSSAQHGSSANMQWPFQSWGASAVIQGHDHVYERVVLSGFPYMTSGLGGRSLYGFNAPIPGSKVRYNADYGALFCDATPTSLLFTFKNTSSTVIDTYSLTIGPPFPPFGLTGFALAGNVNLSWTASHTEGVNRYRVYWSNNIMGGFAPLLDTTNLSATFRPPSRATRFYYMVTALKATGEESGFSNMIGLRMP